jgi:hypothetical protein
MMLAAGVFATGLPACVAGLAESPPTEAPAPLPESRTQPPAPGMVWVPGGWHWADRGWRWIPGRWETPPPLPVRP